VSVAPCIDRRARRCSKSTVFISHRYYRPHASLQAGRSLSTTPAVGAVTVSFYVCVCNTCEWNLFVSQVTLVVPMVIYVFPLPRDATLRQGASPFSVATVDSTCADIGRRLWRTLESFVWNKIGIWMDLCRRRWFSCACVCISSSVYNSSGFFSSLSNSSRKIHSSGRTHAHIHTQCGVHARTHIFQCNDYLRFLNELNLIKDFVQWWILRALYLGETEFKIVQNVILPRPMVSWNVLSPELERAQLEPCRTICKSTIKLILKIDLF